MDKILQYIEENIEEIQKEIESQKGEVDEKTKDKRCSEIYLMFLYLEVYKNDSRVTKEKLEKIKNYLNKLESLSKYYNN